MKNISTNSNYPKTLVIRNSVGGMIWQLYHVNSQRAAEILAKRAFDNAFDGVTLEDYQPDREETFPNWQNDFSTNVELRLLEGDNKIDYLIRKGFITEGELLEYAQKHMDAVDAHDDEQIDRYSQEEDQERRLRDAMMEAEDKYGHYLDEEMQEYMSTYRPHSLHPKYVIASTNFKLEETMVFESDEHGNRLSPDDYGCIAKRLGHVKMWDERDTAVRFCLRDHQYIRRKDFEEIGGCIQSLYERYDSEFDSERTPEQLAAIRESRYKDFIVC